MWKEIKVCIVYVMMRLMHYLLAGLIIRKSRYYLVTHKDVFNSIMSYSSDLFLKNVIYGGKICLDLGSGSGILSIHLNMLCHYALGADISPEASYLTSINLALNNAKNTDVLSGVPESLLEGKFDLILLNPPYLPCEINDEKWFTYAICAGGDLALILKLLKKAFKLLKCNGKLYFTISDLTPPQIALMYTEHLGMKWKLIDVVATPLDRIYLIMSIKKCFNHI